jgi:hypothetical protein
MQAPEGIVPFQKGKVGTLPDGKNHPVPIELQESLFIILRVESAPLVKDSCTLLKFNTRHLAFFQEDLYGAQSIVKDDPLFQGVLTFDRV